MGKTDERVRVRSTSGLVAGYYRLPLGIQYRLNWISQLNNDSRQLTFRLK
jgi:hypothetical protein